MRRLCQRVCDYPVVRVAFSGHRHQAIERSYEVLGMSATDIRFVKNRLIATIILGVQQRN